MNPIVDSNPIFTISADLEAHMDLGRTPYGGRRIVGILGGIVRGRKLNGRILSRRCRFADYPR